MLAGPSQLKSSLLVVALVLALVGQAAALVPPTDGQASRAAAEYQNPALRVQPSLEIYGAHNRAALANRAEVQAFFNRFSTNWEIRMDSRNDRPHLVQGVGIPLFPGRGNSLKAADAGLTAAKPTMADVERLLKSFLASSGDFLRVEGMDLRLRKEGSVQVGENYWTVELQQYHQGVPVEGANVYFRINSGNIVQFGADKVADINLDARASLASGRAWQAALGSLGLAATEVKQRGAAQLKVYPTHLDGEPENEKFIGEAGLGYKHFLGWSFEFEKNNEGFRVVVDAQSGRVQEYVNLTAYATVSGQIYPNTNTDPLVTVNFPFANVTNSTTKTTDANGSYTYSGGTATITLNGKYIRMSDACGAISLSNSTTGDLNFGGSGGTDCTTPGIGGAGNTHSSRSGYYHLTRINRKAATYHPSNTWVNGVLTSNMNINQTCNANWNGSAINFYRSGGGCSNTGELAAVFLHEWGHGFDTNTGGSASENASGEAVGDTFAFLETKDACIGNNFQPGVPCANCRSTCTGVRDLIPFALGGTRTLATPANIADNNGINCDRFACPYSTPQGFPYRGPMGYQGHCESHIASTSNWDLAQSLVTTHGSTAGWAAMDKIWYASLTPSKSAFQVASGGTCNPAATINGCGASNWYTVYLPADDDNGNLADGTPNACRIWDAFNAHGIACGSRPTCSGGGGGGNTAPTVTISSPAAGASFVQGTSVSFAGSATDTQDGTISANLSWSSSINGAIGTGASFSTSTLSVGSHTITASVTDSGGLSGSATRSITITSTSNALTNGVPVTGISGATGSQQFWTLAVPSGASNLSFTTSGGTGDADLYVKFGSAPTTTVRDCASESGTNAETCSFATPSVGTYHVLVYGYAAYSGLTLTGSYSTGPTTVTVTFTSVGAEDGRIWESGETTNVGGGLNSTDNTTGSIRVGDFSDDTQYRSIVSFDTSSIPDGATIISATLRLKRATVSGTSPFTTHGTCTVDIAGATGWGGAVAIAAGDWQAAASSSGVASMSNPASDGTFSTGTLNAAGRTAVNKTGKTQLRVYMTTDDNDDLGSDYMGFYSGEAATGNKPELVIQYQ